MPPSAHTPTQVAPYILFSSLALCTLLLLFAGMCGYAPAVRSDMKQNDVAGPCQPR